MITNSKAIGMMHHAWMLPRGRRAKQVHWKRVLQTRNTGKFPSLDEYHNIMARSRKANRYANAKVDQWRKLFTEDEA